ncbi:putative acyl esterase [Sphingopyxis panaciterrae]|uniref:hypothetical protein n=1 Tax=Sphingopyxis panaciterrae TaxID=363841 RepID=UPI0014211AC9|nr:hypothetical protein [Sphingopyxis panaciterrae]NIJ36673.1 putative acyl esterase [Sphingopyxis panaciterrae]
MIQIPSGQFPLHDRNPQSFVPNIFYAKAEDYRAAPVSILRSGDRAIAIWLPLVTLNPKSQ